MAASSSTHRYATMRRPRRTGIHIRAAIPSCGLAGQSHWCRRSVDAVAELLDEHLVWHVAGQDRVDPHRICVSSPAAVAE